MNEERTNIIDMTDTDGNIVQFEHLLTFEYGEHFYVGLLPVEPIEGMEEDEVLIMRLEEDGENDIFMPVETEEELLGAWSAFMDGYYGEEGAECGGDCEHCASNANCIE